MCNQYVILKIDLIKVESIFGADNDSLTSIYGYA